MSRSISRPYDHPTAAAWLAAQFIGPDFQDDTQDGPTDLIAWLEHRCRTIRAQGIAGAYHYDLPLHTELLRILAAEKAGACGDRDPVGSARCRQVATAGRLAPAT